MPNGEHSSILVESPLCTPFILAVPSCARQPLSHVNLTGFTVPTSGKNRKYLSIQKTAGKHLK